LGTLIAAEGPVAGRALRVEAGAFAAKVIATFVERP
jgi:hypothetical protein